MLQTIIDQEVAIFIEKHKYNFIRPHSSLQNLTPIEYENMLIKIK